MKMLLTSVFGPYADQLLLLGNAEDQLKQSLAVLEGKPAPRSKPLFWRTVSQLAVREGDVLERVRTGRGHEADRGRPAQLERRSGR